LARRSHQWGYQSFIEAEQMLYAIPVSHERLRAIKPVHGRVEPLMSIPK
jgi:hypothetical protein